MADHHPQTETVATAAASAPAVARRRAGPLPLVLAAGLMLAAPAAAERHALLIGLNQYRFVQQGITELNFARADVEQFQEALRAQGYVIRALVDDDAKRFDILAELYRYVETLAPEDTFLLYFAGHGVRNHGVNDQTYWLTYSAELDLLDDQGIRLEHLLDFVRDIPAQQKILLLDHCFSGDVVRTAAGGLTGGGIDFTSDAGNGGGRAVAGGLGIAPRGVVPAGTFEVLRPGAAGMIIVAAARNQALESESLGHGLFTQALIQAFTTREASADEVLLASELIDYLQDEVRSLAADEAFQQQVSDFVVGANTAGWQLASSLPVGDGTEAQAKKEQYMETLIRWNLRQWITRDTKFTCRDVLDKWARSFAGGEPLTEIEQRIFEQIVQAVEGTEAEDLRGPDLEDTVRILLDQ